MAQGGGQSFPPPSCPLATLALATALLVGCARAASGTDGRIAVDADPTPPEGAPLLAPPAAGVVQPMATAPSPPLAAPVVVPGPRMRLRSRAGKRPAPDRLRRYFPCRAPAVFLARMPEPSCLDPPLRRDP